MEYRYELITMPDGQTTLAKLAMDTQVRIVNGGQTGSHQTLDITEEQYQELLQQAATHTIKFDTMSGIVLIPKMQPNTEANQ